MKSFIERIKNLPKWAQGVLALLLLLIVWRVAHKVRLNMTVETDLFSEGQVELNSGHYSSAIEIFDTFLKRDPHHVPSLQFKLEAEMKAERLEDAVKTAEKIYLLEVNNANRFQLGELYRRVGREDMAVKVLNTMQTTPTPAVEATPIHSPSPNSKKSLKIKKKTKI
jgi:lipopolysaccharide biosynthesis regulator YciM